MINWMVPSQVPTPFYRWLAKMVYIGMAPSTNPSGGLIRGMLRWNAAACQPSDGRVTHITEGMRRMAPFSSEW